MNIEKVFLYILQAISGLVGALIANITLKYLNNKGSVDLLSHTDSKISEICLVIAISDM